MKLKEAVYYAAMFMQLDNVCAALENSGGETDEETEKEIDRLVRCANLVLNEAASDYLPLKTTETVRAGDGLFVKYTELSKPIIDLFSVTDKSGRNVKIKQYFDRMIFPYEGEFDVTYSYAPAPVKLDDELPYTERLGARAVAYGTASEYAIISGMTDEAVLWDKRFKDALGLSSAVKRELRLPKRRWL